MSRELEKTRAAERRQRDERIVKRRHSRYTSQEQFRYYETRVNADDSANVDYYNSYSGKIHTYRSPHLGQPHRFDKKHLTTYDGIYFDCDCSLCSPRMAQYGNHQNQSVISENEASWEEPLDDPYGTCYDVDLNDECNWESYNP